MKINPSKGNMFDFVKGTLNPITSGHCDHECIYCYSNRTYLPPSFKLDELMKVNFKESGCYFIQSASPDMFANNIPVQWIKDIMKWLSCVPGNTYLFHTKNPVRYMEFINDFPYNSILGVTIESDAYQKNICPGAPIPAMRAIHIVDFKNLANKLRPDIQYMVTIEPIIKFHLNDFINMIKLIIPYQVNIGANSREYQAHLPEPTNEEIKQLIKALVDLNIKVNIKPNLSRLYKE